MKKVLISVISALLLYTVSFAEKIEISNFMLSGPVLSKQPFVIDSTNVNGEKLPEQQELYTATFDIRVLRFSEVELSLANAKNISVKINGENSPMKGNMVPNIYNINVEFSTDSISTVKIFAETSGDGRIANVTDFEGKHLYSVYDCLHARRVSSVKISPSGKYALISTSQTLPGGKSESVTRLENLQTHISHKLPVNPRLNWMPRSDKYYYTAERNGYRQLITVDPATGAETIITDKLPKEGSIEIAPTEDWILITTSADGPKELYPDVYQVLNPEDRQAGWRSRTNISKFDIASGKLQTLTYGHSNIYLSDISSDGRKIIFRKMESIFTQRPTDVSSFFIMDVNTLEVDEIISKDGFVDECIFSPDGKSILIAGSPEALNGIGKRVLKDQIPSKYDIQLYLMSVSDKAITPLTTEFNPSVESIMWSSIDNQIYFTASDKDSVNFFSLNPVSKKITEYAMPEEMINGISFANNANVMLWYGNSVANSDRIYLTNLKNKQTVLIENISSESLKNVEIAKVTDWTYVTSRGDKIYARYYVPFDFDPNKKYPLIVNFYGGCTPESRSFESRYPEHSYANLGYVFLEITPSGAIGFGQEFSARHVNTAGKVVAEDIIEGVQQFCNQFTFVNSEKIGCIGASYGGFMSQYLVTQTDLFTTAISHAGISGHTSYWGEGYWGYSYSEVSMADSYPWTRKDLYVDQSPLYNADKIHTPLLLLHGDSDTNVPPGESIQMFTALQLLRVESALVFVKDQNHHITDYNKRIRWEQTIYAWFAKYLQDDDQWWNSMYPEKNL